MLKIPYEDVLQKIEKAANLSQEEIEQKIQKKLDQLSGLISKEGAAHIVANELGVKLFEQISGKVKIDNVLAGMRNVETVGKVLQKYDVREFQTATGSGKVGSLLVGDETGVIRLVLWHDQTNKLGGINSGDIVKVVGGYSKDNQGRKEIHLNDKSKLLINPEGEKVDQVKPLVVERKNINQLSESDNRVEIIGTVVQVFDVRFYEVCPECGKRARPKEGGFFCENHNQVEPDYNYLLNLVLDDGTETIRVTFFRDTVDSLLHKTRQEILLFRNSPDKFEDVKTNLLGESFKLVGRANKNMFDRLEFIVREVSPIDPQQELDDLNSSGSGESAGSESSSHNSQESAQDKTQQDSPEKSSQEDVQNIQESINDDNQSNDSQENIQQSSLKGSSLDGSSLKGSSLDGSSQEGSSLVGSSQDTPKSDSAEDTNEDASESTIE